MTTTASVVAVSAPASVINPIVVTASTSSLEAYTADLEQSAVDPFSVLPSYIVQRSSTSSTLTSSSSTSSTSASTTTSSDPGTKRPQNNTYLNVISEVSGGQVIRRSSFDVKDSHHPPQVYRTMKKPVSLDCLVANKPATKILPMVQKTPEEENEDDEDDDISLAVRRKEVDTRSLAEFFKSTGPEMLQPAVDKPIPESKKKKPLFSFFAMRKLSGSLDNLTKHGAASSSSSSSSSKKTHSERALHNTLPKSVLRKVSKYASSNGQDSPSSTISAVALAAYHAGTVVQQPVQHMSIQSRIANFYSAYNDQPVLPNGASILKRRRTVSFCSIDELIDEKDMVMDSKAKLEEQVERESRRRMGFDSEEDETVSQPAVIVKDQQTFTEAIPTEEEEEEEGGGAEGVENTHQLSDNEDERSIIAVNDSADEEEEEEELASDKVDSSEDAREESSIDGELGSDFEEHVVEDEDLGEEQDDDDDDMEEEEKNIVKEERPKSPPPPIERVPSPAVSTVSDQASSRYSSRRDSLELSTPQSRGGISSSSSGGGGGVGTGGEKSAIESRKRYYKSVRHIQVQTTEKWPGTSKAKKEESNATKKSEEETAAADNERIRQLEKDLKIAQETAVLERKRREKSEEANRRVREKFNQVSAQAYKTLRLLVEEKRRLEAEVKRLKEMTERPQEQYPHQLAQPRFSLDSSSEG